MPAVIFEQRVVIGADVARWAVPRDGVVEHATQPCAIDGAGLDAEADNASGALIHDDKDPVRPQGDGRTAKEVDAPEAVLRVPDEGEPGGATAARLWSGVSEEDPGLGGAP